MIQQGHYMADRITGRKETGCVYTPPDIVNEVLDAAGYVPTRDLRSMTVLEPSCGNGAFLVEIASRLVESIRLHSPSSGDVDSLDGEIASTLSQNIMSIEIDGDALEDAKSRVLAMLEKRYSYSPKNPDSIFDSWHAGDAIGYLQSDKTRYDFVVGNPPYVRIHNVGDIGNLREIPWCSSGMTDMFYAFYYLGLNHLNGNGTLAYIAPSVWMTSKYGKAMRDDLIAGGNVKTVIDHGDDQLFDGISAYVATTVLTAGRNGSIEYSSPSSGKLTVPYDEAWIGGKLMPIADGETRDAFREVADGNICDKSVSVRTGFQTGNDALFLDEAGIFPDALKIDVVKSSTGAMGRMFFPYDADMALLPLDDVNRACLDEGKPPIDAMKPRMSGRSGIIDGNWWGFARTQAISSVPLDKVAIPSLFKPSSPIKAVEAPSGTGVYGMGYYVTGMDIDEIRSALSSRLFAEYAASVGTPKRGGYLAVNGGDMERYLRWYMARNR